MLAVLRLNLFGAWMVVLVAESTGVGYGMGQVIMLARNTFNPSLVFFTIAVIGCWASPSTGCCGRRNGASSTGCPTPRRSCVALTRRPSPRPSSRRGMPWSVAASASLGGRHQARA